METQPRRFGDYLLLDRLGAGAGAELWRAASEHDAQRPIAVRKLQAHVGDDDARVQRFVGEAQNVTCLRHPNILRTLDVGLVRNEYFVAMEFVPGADLLNLLVRCTDLRIRIPQSLAIFITMEVLTALGVGHDPTEGRSCGCTVVHGNISASSVMIGYDGGVKLGDFGAAPAWEDGAPPKRSHLGYASPERLDGLETDHRTDLFSVSVILYEMLTMNRLFGDQDPEVVEAQTRAVDATHVVAQLPPEIPDRLRKVLERALRSTPARRFEDAAQFKAALADYLKAVRHQANAAGLSRFMRSVFAREFEAEQTHQRQIEHAIDTLDSGVRLRNSTGDDRYAWSPSSRFRIRDKDGQVQGPLGLQALVKQVRIEGPHIATQISIDGSGWIRSRDVPALFGQQIEPLEAASVADFEGTFTPVDLPRLLYRYGACHVTGRMQVDCGDKRKALYWRHGRLEFVTSNLRSERLGEFLIQQRLVGRSRFEEVLGGMSDLSQRIGEALVKEELITRFDLLSALSTQIRHRLMEIFSWPSGRYAFFKDVPPPAQVLPLEQGLCSLINEGITTRTPLAQIHTFFRAQEQARPVKRTHSLLTIEGLGLSAGQSRVWSALAVGEPLSDQIRRLTSIPGASQARVYQVLFLMERLEFISLER